MAGSSAPVGVLALQGGWAAHVRALADLGHATREVRTPADVDGLAGMIFPGGESTTHLKLIDRFGLRAPLDAFVASGKPVFCTCAGMILAATAVHEPSQLSYGWVDIEVARNGWGRQVHSFEAQTDAPLEGDDNPLKLLFIRAPRVQSVGPKATVMATFEGEPVLVRQGNVWAGSFHPELTDERRLHARIFGRGVK
ncbi:MAG: 5'-phosphate synthase pdxT subunit [Bradymonadia bacterium]